MSEKKSRILWRCRRGIKEMDIVLQDFIKNSYDELNNENKSAFSKLLEEQDLDILNWVLGKDKPEDKTLIEIIKKIRSSRNII
ncbi:MAG: succinate dehydrogenase assembly factor 2 [Legionellales bacterium]|nr:succinate dehydrogenase assembly factor 2 [Legionellales bacterium]MBK68881.1 succinate dehydrogenase assembly factor 2 [Legionellales bacterium]|tara:strand:+ start:440 stop:688 length:249 start_codon:yes stop_codon:yes gene_type:complete